MTDRTTPTENGGFMIDDQYYVAFEDGDFLEVEESGKIAALVRVYNVKNGNVSDEVEMTEELMSKVESALTAFLENAIETTMNEYRAENPEETIYDEDGFEVIEVDVTGEDNQ